MACRIYLEAMSDEPVTIIDTTSEEGWNSVRSLYGRNRHIRPLERLISLARDLRVRYVLIENDYVDPDYRSQFSLFYSRQFTEYRARCDRLHFFTRSPSRYVLSLDKLQASYRGYAVMRPVPAAPVGRVLIPPPPWATVIVRATEKVMCLRILA